MMSWHKLELQNKELFGPDLHVIEKDGVFQFQIAGQRKYIKVNKDEMHRLNRWIKERLIDNTASQVQNFGSVLDKCRGRT